MNSGYRLRVPYGTLLCISDKPLHGEIMLPGDANAFYVRAVTEHLKIGPATLEKLKEADAAIHSRKLRSSTNRHFADAAASLAVPATIDAPVANDAAWMP